MNELNHEITGRFPSLDGLRALSIGLVLVQHSLMAGHVVPNGRPCPFILNVIGNGELGVSIFFVVSGFLITSQLLKEDSKTGRISLKRFYIRRAYRILPAYYTFLIVLLLVQQAGFLDIGLREWTPAPAFLVRWQAALLFLRDYIVNGDWWTDHTWSLSVEEQFYLLWPACLALAGATKSKKVAMALIIASPAIRVACHLIWRDLGVERELVMLHMRLDGVMTGCALAIFYKHLQFKWRWILPAAIFLFVLSPYLKARFFGYYELPLGLSLDNLAIAYLVLYVVRNPNSVFGRVLNHRAIAHIGVISYSLYLWQELFLGKFSFPFGVLGAFLAAELSWRFVEKPALKMRDQAMKRESAVITC